MVFQINLSPYCTVALNTTQSSALLANTLTLFVGLMLIIDFNMEAEAKRAGDESYNNSIGRSVVSVLIVIVNIAVLAIPTSVAVLQSDIKNKILKFCLVRKGKKEESEDQESNQESEDQESNHSDSELPVVVDTLSQPAFSSGQALFLLPIRLGVSIEEPERVSTESSKTSSLITPILNLDLNEEVPSCNEGSFASSNFQPIKINASLVFKTIPTLSTGYATVRERVSSLGFQHDTGLCFVASKGGNEEIETLPVSGSVNRHEEQQVPINFDQVLLSTSSMTSFIEAEADSAPSQMPVLELQSQAYDDSRHLSGDIAGHLKTGTFLHAEIRFQHAANEAIRLVAEELDEAKECSKSRENYF